MTSFYTGVGSRRTPADVLTQMTKLALMLDAHGYVLRSGGASGADTAFEVGASEGRRQVFLPWASFNQNPSPLYFGNGQLDLDAALKFAANFHPTWHACSEAAKKMHARNCFQVLGASLHEPSKFLICWTEDGRDVGGTAQALRVARHHQVPIYNLGAQDGSEKLKQFMGTL